MDKEMTEQVFKFLGELTAFLNKANQMLDGIIEEERENRQQARGASAAMRARPRPSQYKR